MRYRILSYSIIGILLSLLVVIIININELNAQSNISFVSPINKPINPKPSQTSAAEVKKYFHLLPGESIYWEKRLTGIIGPQRKTFVVAPILTGGSIGATHLAVFEDKNGSIRPIGNLDFNDEILGIRIENGRLYVRTAQYESNDIYHHPSFLQERIFAYNGEVLEVVGFNRISNMDGMTIPSPSPSPTIIASFLKPIPTTVPKYSTPQSNVSIPYPSSSTSSCDDETIDTVVEDGSIILTIEGNRYEVDAGDTVTSSLWQTSDDILICETSTGIKIIDKDEKESVEGQRL